METIPENSWIDGGGTAKSPGVIFPPKNPKTQLLDPLFPKPSIKKWMSWDAAGSAWVLDKWMLEASRFFQVFFPPLRSRDPDPKIPPQNPSAGALSTGNAPKFQEFSTHPVFLFIPVGSSGWDWNSPSQAELGIIPLGIIP